MKKYTKAYLALVPLEIIIWGCVIFNIIQFNNGRILEISLIFHIVMAILGLVWLILYTQSKHGQDSPNRVESI